LNKGERENRTMKRQNGGNTERKKEKENGTRSENNIRKQEIDR
jgi:hypothetical protein